jgi:hypothetical protein
MPFEISSIMIMSVKLIFFSLRSFIVGIIIVIIRVYISNDIHNFSLSLSLIFIRGSLIPSVLANGVIDAFEVREEKEARMDGMSFLMTTKAYHLPITFFSLY